MGDRLAAAGGADFEGNSGSGFAMVFALLVAAILWNLGTCTGDCGVEFAYMIGSILGVGLAYS